MILSISRLLIVGALMPFAFMKGASFGANKKMNVILIICDDLNDFEENFELNIHDNLFYNPS